VTREAIINAVAAEVENGKTLSQILKEEIICNRQWWQYYSTKTDRERIRDIVWTWPLGQQLGANQPLSPPLQNAICGMALSGLSDGEISIVLVGETIKEHLIKDIRVRCGFRRGPRAPGVGRIRAKGTKQRATDLVERRAQLIQCIRDAVTEGQLFTKACADCGTTSSFWYKHASDDDRAYIHGVMETWPLMKRNVAGLPLPDGFLDQVRNMLRAGMNQTAIAIEMRCNANFISKIVRIHRLREDGVPTKRGRPRRRQPERENPAALGEDGGV